MARIFDYPAMERVHMGAAFDEAVADEAERAGRQARLPHAGRHDLARNGLGGPAGTAAVGGAGAALAGRWDRMASHTPRGDVIAATGRRARPGPTWW